MQHNYRVLFLSALGLVAQFLLVATHPILDSILDPVLDSVVNPILDPVLDSVVNPILDPVLDSVVNPILDPILDPIGSATCTNIEDGVCEEEDLHRSPRLKYFIQELPIPPIAEPSHSNPRSRDSEWDEDDEPLYEISLDNIKHRFHPHLPATDMYGFNGIHPGPTFQAEINKPIKVDWHSRLSKIHPLGYAIDPTLSNGEIGELPAVRNTIHNHGAHAVNTSDGLPNDWITPGNTLHYRYSNDARASQWYHDHAHGITRLNVYAGLAGFYFVRTPGLDEELGLPTGEYEIPLIIQDKFFNRDGSLYYPTTGHGNNPIWVSDMEADTPVLNGKVAPYLKVEPRKYRFRLLNGANYREWSLYFRERDLHFTQVGGDGGYLPEPVVVREVPLAAAERADVVVDFSGFEGRSVILRNSAPPHESDAVFLPVLMRFDVLDHAKPHEETAIASPLPFTPIPPCIRRYRTMTLSEPNEVYLMNERPFHAPVVVRPKVNTTEIWQIINLTDETHPIHVHLGEFKLLKRCPFRTERWVADGRPDYIEPYIKGPCGDGHGVLPGETGHKDVFRHFAHTVTIIKLPFNDHTGTYVMHCHKLEHEDNDMMRPWESVGEDRRSPWESGEDDWMNPWESEEDDDNVCVDYVDD